MSSLDDSKVRDWQQRAARYRQFSILLGEDETVTRLRALALEIEQRIETLGQSVVLAEELRRDQAMLLAEIDVFLARARGAIFFARHLLRPLRFSADDLREEARLCREEAQASEGAAMHRAFAVRARNFAMLGEEIDREKAEQTV